MRYPSFGVDFVWWVLWCRWFVVRLSLAIPFAKLIA